jgi:hypothetical protein
MLLAWDYASWCTGYHEYVLRLAGVEDVFKVTLISGQAFVVHLPNCELEVKHSGKLYVANYHDVLAPQAHQVCTTVHEN